LEDAEAVLADFQNIARGFKLLSLDYLGGHGSRGYGRVGFHDFEVRVMDGECPVAEEELQTILKDVEEYGAFSLQA